jgi:hypothetical protein
MVRPVITSFSQLAPLLIQQYERYLPTAFDESLSLLQKVNKVIKHLDELGVLTNGVVDKWNEVMEWILNEGLSESVTLKLDEMVSDGTLSDLINNVVFGEIKQRQDDFATHVNDYENLVTNGDWTLAIQTAINEASHKVKFNGIYKISGNLTVPRGITLEGTELTKIYSDIQTYISYKGSYTYNYSALGQRLLFGVKGISFNKVGLCFGDTADDFANSSFVKECEFANGEFAIRYRNNSWINNIDNVHIHHCTKGVFFDYVNGVNAGANQAISNSNIYDCTHGIYINGATQSGDGADIKVNNTNIEHCEASIKSVGADGVYLFWDNAHIELNSVCAIDNEGAGITIGKLWLFENTASTYLAHFIIKSGYVFVESGRIGFQTNKLSKITGGTLLIDLQKVVTLGLFGTMRPYTTDSTQGVRVRHGFVFEKLYEAVPLTYSPPYTLDQIAHGDTNIREYEFVVNLTTPTHANIPELQFFVNPGGASVANIPLTKESGKAKCKVTYNGDKLYIEILWITDTTQKIILGEVVNPHPVTTTKIIDVAGAFIGTGTITISRITKKCI